MAQYDDDDGGFGFLQSPVDGLDAMAWPSTDDPNLPFTVGGTRQNVESPVAFGNNKQKSAVIPVSDRPELLEDNQTLGAGPEGNADADGVTTELQLTVIRLWMQRRQKEVERKRTDSGLPVSDKDLMRELMCDDQYLQLLIKEAELESKWSSGRRNQPMMKNSGVLEMVAAIIPTPLKPLASGPGPGPGSAVDAVESVRKHRHGSFITLLIVNSLGRLHHT